MKSGIAPSAPALSRYQQAAGTFWAERSEQERKLLGAGGIVCALALLYALLIAPALDGRARLQQEVPALRQEAAQLQALAKQAGDLKRQAPTQVPVMSRDSLSDSLKARGLTAQSVTLTGEYAKLQLNGVAFSGLMAWLDALRRENRIAVQEAAISALAQDGMVDAALTLHQNAGGGQ